WDPEEVVCHRVVQIAGAARESAIVAVVSSGRDHLHEIVEILVKGDAETHAVRSGLARDAVLDLVELVGPSARAGAGLHASMLSEELIACDVLLGNAPTAGHLAQAHDAQLVYDILLAFPDLELVLEKTAVADMKIVQHARAENVCPMY